MQQVPDAFLIVEKGEPYGIGEALPLLRGKVLLGRASPDRQRGFFFFSPFVSRLHATIEFEDGSYFLTDLESRHGTRVNDKRLVSGEACDIRHGDRISLARDEVVLTYVTAARTGSETLDYPESQPDSILVLDPDRREFILGGKPLTLSKRRYAFLLLLYENRGRVVDDCEIKRAVWPERPLGADGMPLVTNQELTTLVFHLRNELKPHRDLIRTIRHHGYILDLEQGSPDAQHGQ